MVSHFPEDTSWMQEALAEAMLSGKDVPVGALIVREGRLIARAHNKREQEMDPSAHAEIVAMRAAAKELAGWRLDGSTLYTTLEPCPMCAEAIIQARVSRVVFGAYDPISGAFGSVFNLCQPKRIYPIPEVTGGIFEDDCKRLIVDFFRKRR